MIYFYPSLETHCFVFSYSKLQNSNYVEISSSYQLLDLIVACLRRKKEVYIFPDRPSVVTFSKGKHYVFVDEFVYFNPSIRNRLSLKVDDQKAPEFSSLENCFVVS